MSYCPPVKLSRTEAADYIGVKPGTLAVWASAGKGPKFAKIGHKVLYLQAELDSWIESRTTNCSSTLRDA